MYVITFLLYMFCEKSQVQVQNQIPTSIINNIYLFKKRHEHLLPKQCSCRLSTQPPLCLRTLSDNQPPDSLSFLFAVNSVQMFFCRRLTASHALSPVPERQTYFIRSYHPCNFNIAVRFLARIDIFHIC